MGETISTVGDLIDLTAKEHRLINPHNTKRDRQLKMNNSHCLFLTKVEGAVQEHAGEYKTATLKVACRNLPKNDIFSKSDPLVTAEIQELSGATSLLFLVFFLVLVFLAVAFCFFHCCCLFNPFPLLYLSLLHVYFQENGDTSVKRNTRIIITTLILHFL